jgi:hypothetical protein
MELIPVTVRMEKPAEKAKQLERIRTKVSLNEACPMETVYIPGTMEIFMKAHL